MTTGSVRVRPARAADASGMAEVLAEAFGGTDTFRWIAPDAVRRPRLLDALFTGTLRHLHPAAQGPLVALAGGRVVGAAVWAPPEQWRPGWWREARLAPALISAAGLRGLVPFARRGLTIDAAMAADHPRTPHWYLSALGVSAGGRGTGTALLRAGLDRADADGLPAYLECEDHLFRFYGRFGFTSLGPLTVPRGAPPHLGLWREPGGG